MSKSLRLLSIGKGNLIKRSVEFKELGVSGKKEIPAKLLEKCNLDAYEAEAPSPDQTNDTRNGGLK